MELPDVGARFERLAAAAVVESTKAANDVYAPLSGEIIAVNERLEDEPNLVNESAEDQGWFFRMRLDDEAEIDELLDGDAYRAFVEEIE